MSKTVSKVTAESVNAAHRMAKQCAETAIDHAVTCGKLLAQRKASMAHGEFTAWVEQWCEFSDRQARRYMEVAAKTDTRVRFESMRQALGYDKPPAAKPAPRKEEVAPVVVAKPAEKVEIVATFPAVPPAEPEPEDDWSPDELAKAEAIEREYDAAMAKVMDSDDKLAAAHAEIKRQAAEIAILKLARDGYMNGKTEMTRLLDAALRKVDRLEKKLKAADNELEALRERVAIMESA